MYEINKEYMVIVDPAVNDHIATLFSTGLI